MRITRTVESVGAVAAAIAGSLGVGSSADAATVSWSSVQTITSNLNIQNPDAVLVARDYGNNANVNVPVGASTVTFIGTNAPFNESSGYYGSFFDTTGTTVDSTFEFVLDSFGYSYAGDGGNVETLPFTGLTPGATYLLQVFTSDDRGLTWNTGLDVGGVQQTIYTGGGASTFANATITLGAGETSFNLAVTGLTSGPGGASSSGYDLALVNALVLSQVSAPEPASLGLLGLGAVGLLARRRKSVRS